MMQSIMGFHNNRLYHVIRALRPRQWLKNLAIFAPALFFGSLFDPEVLSNGMMAFFIFILVSSATYLINDVVDAPKDRQHPIKKNRPIAGGFISERFALVLAYTLVTIALILSRVFFTKFFILTVLGYFCIQIAYSLYLRNVIILDALTVATGFVVRVFAGTLATSVAISSWLILSVIGLSLLLAFGKRRSERTILAAQNIALTTRNTLKHYPDTLLDSMISMSSTFAIVTYALFAFQTEVSTNKGISERLPASFSSPKWMMVTIPIVIYGVARYLYVIYEKKEGESPERVLLSDRPLLVTVFVWVIAIVAIIDLLPGI